MELQPNEKAFLNSLQKIEDRLNVERAPDGTPSIRSANEITIEEMKQKPENVAERTNTLPELGKSASPEECVKYIKRQQQAGKTWDGCLRGTILYAAMIRLHGLLAEAYKLEQWARKFIDLADNDFKVTEQDAYMEKGSAFRQTFRIGMLVSEFQTLNALRGEQVNGPYSMEMSLNLCMEIIKRANAIQPVSFPDKDSTISVDHYLRIQFYVAAHCKTLALAHSTIASHLNILQAIFSPEEFNQIVIHHGLIEQQEEPTDAFALIAKHYRLAAQAELSDARDCAVFWWGYAANVAQAQIDSGFTLGDLRTAIAKAEDAERERDVGLFGVNQERGGTFETIAKLTAEHYKTESDSFNLPQVQLVRESQTKSSLRVDGQVLCSDFTEYE